MQKCAVLLLAVAACGGSPASTPADAAPPDVPAAARVTAPLDPGFGDEGILTVDHGDSFNALNRLALDADGRIFAAGWQLGGSAWNDDLCRITTAGALDDGFGSGGCTVTGADTWAMDLVDTPAGILVAGFDSHGPRVWRHDATGALNPTWPSELPGGISEWERLIAMDGDEPVVFGVSGDALRVTRLSADGAVLAQIDATDPAMPLAPTAAARKPDGGWLVSTGYAVGDLIDVAADLSTLAVTPATHGVTDLDVLPDGRVLVLDAFGLHRLLANRDVDPSFGDAGTFAPQLTEKWTGFTRLADGRIALFGGVDGADVGYPFQVALLEIVSADGVLDTSLGVDGRMEISYDNAREGEPEVQIFDAVEEASGDLIVVTSGWDEDSRWAALSRVLL